jgi:hypothetical protein
VCSVPREYRAIDQGLEVKGLIKKNWLFRSVSLTDCMNDIHIFSWSLDACSMLHLKSDIAFGVTLTLKIARLHSIFRDI